MYKKLIVYVLLFFVAGNLLGQNKEEEAVKAVVNQLFAAMKNADSTLLKDCFADAAVLQTIAKDKSGETIVRNESVKQFVSSIGKLEVGVADERISFQQVLIDGALAMVWTPYQFYFKQNFSHCGVNSFQLVRFNGKWKIQYLIDTRRKEGCAN